MPDFKNSPMLVTGAAGHLGGLIVKELLARGATNVTAAARDPLKINAPGAKTARADFDDAASLDAVFKGIERLMIVSTDAMEPGKRLAQHLRAVEAAQRAGVRHIFYTSLSAPEPGSPIPFAPDHHMTEEAIKRTGANYTILRHNWYFENTLLGMPQAIASGAYYTSAGQGGLAQAARADFAAADAGAMITEDGKATYELGGPEAITMDLQIALFNKVLGSKVNVVHLDDAGLEGGLRAAGVPEFFVGLLVGADASIRQGRMGKVNGEMERLSGRKPQRFEDWLTANKAMFAK
jgi:NAD(P)H dehydrogenase (quinone)